MNKELAEIAEWAAKTAKSAGADDCKVGISGQRFVEISYREHKPEAIKEASTRGLNVQIFVNGRYSSQSTSDLRKAPLQEFLTNAVKTTRLLAEDPFRTLPDPKYYAGQVKMDLALFDPTYEKFTPEQRHEMVQIMENACLKAGGEKVISVTASMRDTRSESIVLTSNGFQGARETTNFTAVAEMTAKDEGDRRPEGYYYASCRHRGKLVAPDKIGSEAAARTLDLLGGKKIATETLPIIVENQAVPSLLNGFLQAMFGRNIQQKQSFLMDKKGQKVGNENFTIIDDPLIVGGLGSQLFDGDGFAAKKRVMVDKGVLQDFYIDWYYSRKLGWEPTTGGTSNLIIPPGKRSVQEIMKELGRGILITDFIGGNSNATTGDASIGIIGKLFENGEPVQSVAEMNIADNHLKFWNRLIEVADDPWLYSSWRTPSLVFEEVVVSGA